MNENINLAEILKDCPRGTKLYSPIFGEVQFEYISGYGTTNYPIVVTSKNKKGNACAREFTEQGKYYNSPYGECMLFPSKDQRDWSKFKVKKTKFDPNTLQPFDKVLARCNSDYCYWFADFVAMPATIYDRIPCVLSKKDCDMVIPYNEETNHLVGTKEDAPEYYKYWEE